MQTHSISFLADSHLQKITPCCLAATLRKAPSQTPKFPSGLSDRSSSLAVPLFLLLRNKNKVKKQVHFTV